MNKIYTNEENKIKKTIVHLLWTQLLSLVQNLRDGGGISIWLNEDIEYRQNNSFDKYCANILCGDFDVVEAHLQTKN
ncbi:hypothetical protein BpHYR1_002779 [Brachionus plicatilis]|uniref:Uncharacterized protein n=1 Tax=Brachionus plicatilis TaxID=10195 RepID=A0A3M7SZM8_BRAPC|nr:hypothetical protein BpHYR1_002779 [Brachionus plicatilis]